MKENDLISNHVLEFVYFVISNEKNKQATTTNLTFIFIFFYFADHALSFMTITYFLLLSISDIIVIGSLKKNIQSNKNLDLN